MFLILSLLLSFFLLTFSPLFYSLFLAMFSRMILCLLAYNFFIPSLISLVIILVYLGSMIIIIGYTCAVVPNLHYSLSSVTFSPSLTVLALVSIFIYYIPLYSYGSSPVFSLSLFFYGPLGSFIFLPVILFMVLVLLSSSSYIYISSPFRSS